MFNPAETADNLKKNGGFIAGIPPRQATADYLDYVLTRPDGYRRGLSCAGVCVAPEIFIAKYSVPFQLGGTGLLIVVNVTIDFK